MTAHGPTGSKPTASTVTATESSGSTATNARGSVVFGRKYNAHIIGNSKYTAGIATK